MGKNNHNENSRGLGTQWATPYQRWFQRWPKYPSKQQAVVLYTRHVPDQSICMGKKTFHTPPEINMRGFSLVQRSCWTWSWRCQKTQPDLWGWFVWRDQEVTSRRHILPTAGERWRGSAHTGKPQRTWTPLLHVQNKAFHWKYRYKRKGRESQLNKLHLSVITLCPSPQPPPLQSKARRDAIMWHSWHPFKPLGTCHPKNFGLCMSHTLQYLAALNYDKTIHQEEEWPDLLHGNKISHKKHATDKTSIYSSEERSLSTTD